MEKFEIKKIGPFSAFKVAIYFTIVMTVMFLLIGLIIAIIGAATGSKTALFMGIAYMLMPIILVAVYGALAALFALIYNWLAGKFGGLEISLEEKEEKKKELIAAENSSNTNIE